jgi:hypothetical protein
MSNDDDIDDDKNKNNDDDDVMRAMIPLNIVLKLFKAIDYYSFT